MSIGFSLEVPKPALLVEEERRLCRVETAEEKTLREQAETNALAIINLDMDSLTDKKKFTGSIESFGLDTMRKSSDKNNLLRTTVGKLSQSGDEGGMVSKGLVELRNNVKDLDPSLINFTKTGILGKMFNPLRGYFQKYEKAENVISDIITSLNQGKQILKDDNVTLQIEQQVLRALSKKLTSEIAMASAMDEAIEVKLNEARDNGMEIDKVNFIQEEILYPLRQRVMDLQQMVVVNTQGIISFEVIRRNNLELMRGVDRACTVTVSALRVAVMLASALYNQKIVLKKIQMLNETTNNLIAGTSKMLKDQGVEIHKQASESTISPEILKQAFVDVLSSLDDISSYKQAALPQMKNIISDFKTMAEEGEKAIIKLEKGNVAISAFEG